MKNKLKLLLAVVIAALTLSIFAIPASAHIEASGTYFILRLIADDLEDPVFGKGRVNDCYYPKVVVEGVGETTRTMPEIYVWGSCTITADGAIGKISPKAKASAPMFEIDTMPQVTNSPSKEFRYFVINIKASKAMSGKRMNLVSLGNKYIKNFPVDFTGEWQKIVVDLYDDTNWTVKNSAGKYDPLTESPYKAGQVTYGAGFRVDFPSFYGKDDVVENFSENYLVDWFGFMVDPNEEILSGPLYTDMPYMKGYADGTFGVSNTMTRAEACTIVARLKAGSDEKVPEAAASRFSDVALTDWYAKYVSYLDSLGYLSSYNGTFLPNQAITRAEFVELVYNINTAPAVNTGVAFSDVPADHARYNAIMAAASAGIVGGYEDGTFKPDNTITRAEVTKVINVATGRIAFDNSICVRDYNYFKDLDNTHWAFDHIVEATVEHTYKKNSKNQEKWYNAYIYDVVDYDATKAKIAEVDAAAAKLREEIRTSESDYLLFGTAYYVDPNGNDNNNGKSPETAWKTLAKVNNANFKEGDVVLFKRGGEWRGQLLAKSGIAYSAYGEGAKPIINASSMDYINAYWKLTDTPNVYECEKVFASDPGLIVFDGGAERAFKQIPGHHGYEGGKENLKNDLDFIHDQTTKRIYLRSDKGNPKERFTSIEVNEGKHGIKISGHNIQIDNLAIKHAGYHGVGSGTVKGLYVTNCEFYWIGGSIQGGAGYGTRYGNAVEVYGGCDGFVMDHNYVYQVYDAGLTHQHASGGTNQCIQKDVTYSNNLIEYCVYSIEYFLGMPADAKTERYQENILIENNIMRYAGFGFGYQRRDNTTPAHIKSWDHANYLKEGSYFIVRNNVFDRSRRMLIHCGAVSEDDLPKFENNVYIQYDNLDTATIGRYKKNPTTNIPVSKASSYVMATMGIEDNPEFYYAQNDDIAALPIR